MLILPQLKNNFRYKMENGRVENLFLKKRCFNNNSKKGLAGKNISDLDFKLLLGKKKVSRGFFWMGKGIM